MTFSLKPPKIINPVINGSKKCTKCGKIKKVDLFSRKNRLSPQYNSKCKACITIEGRQQRAAKAKRDLE